jgi:division/cell wall cluster transcriptional repressor MraZ
VGTFERKLDSSNRFRLPREILRELRPEVVERLPCLSISGECLLVFPPKPFREIIEHFSNVEISNPQQRQLARDLFANTENCKVDGAGRMTLPIHSRKCAGVCSAIVLIGAGKYFEIWAKERFHAQRGREGGKPLRELLRGDGLAI